MMPNITPSDSKDSPVDTYLKVYQASLECGLVPLYCTIGESSIRELQSIQLHQQRQLRAMEFVSAAITERLAPGIEVKVSEKWPGIYIIQIEDYQFDVSHKVEEWLDDQSDACLVAEFNFHTTVPVRFAKEIYLRLIKDAA